LKAASIFWLISSASFIACEFVLDVLLVLVVLDSLQAGGIARVPARIAEQAVAARTRRMGFLHEGCVDFSLRPESGLSSPWFGT